MMILVSPVCLLGTAAHLLYLLLLLILLLLLLHLLHLACADDLH
jgi:hypothetical protein